MAELHTGEPRAPTDYQLPDNPIPGPVETASVWSYASQAAPYRSFACTVEYQWDTGWAQVPTAGPDPADPATPSCQLVKLHASYGTKVVRYWAVRDGAQPALPSPVPSPGAGGDNLKLLSAAVTPSVPEPLDGGTAYRYEVRGEYRYALLSPLTDATGFPVGSGPYTDTPAALHAVRPEQFSRTVLG